MKTEQIKEIINAIFASERMKELQKEDPIKDKKQNDTKEDGYPRRDVDYKLEQLSDFLAEDLAELIKIPGLLEWLKGELKSDLEGIWDDINAIMEAYNSRDGFVHGDRSLGDITEEISKQIEKVYTEMLDSEWKGLTVEKAKEKIGLTGSTYVALLDEKDVLTREPFPAIANKTTKVDAVIVESPPGELRKTRDLHINLDPPVTRNGLGGPFTVKGHSHRVRPDEVKTVIFQT